MTKNRHYNKWSVNELLSLQREYELLKMTPEEIAEKHERSVDAILFRLINEGFLEKRVKVDKKQLDKRIGHLESSVSEMKIAVNEIVNNFMESKRVKMDLRNSKTNKCKLQFE